MKRADFVMLHLPGVAVRRRWRRADAACRPAKSSSGTGFSLIELLVVLALIALLASLVLPALGRAKVSARRAQCLSQLRQMVLAAHAYTDAFGGSFPIAYYTETRNGVTVAHAWDLSTVLENPARVVPGILWQATGGMEIQQCPAFAGAANWLTDPHTGYNYNTSFLGHGQFEAIPEPAKTGAVRQPAGTAIFGDGQYAAGANKFMRAPWPNPGDATFRGRWAGTQGYRHGGRSNVAFCDGHAESLRARFTENQDGAARVAPGTGFLSPDNSLYDLE